MAHVDPGASPAHYQSRPWPVCLTKSAAALTFVLEIEEENPAAGEPSVPGNADPPVPIERTAAIFYNVIFGGAVAIGTNASVAVAVTPGDVASLMRFLEGQGVGRADREELAAALEADAAGSNSQLRPGDHVRHWIGNMTLKLAASSGRVSEGAAGGLIAGAFPQVHGADLAPCGGRRSLTNTIPRRHYEYIVTTTATANARRSERVSISRPPSRGVHGRAVTLRHAPAFANRPQVLSIP